MAEQKIEFRKIRDFGENINDTFVFIRQNFKPLIGTFFAICGVLMLLQAILSGMYQSNSFGILDDMMKGKTIRTQTFENIFNGGYFLMLLAGVVTYIAMQVSIISYIKFYVQNDGQQPTIEDVWHIFKKYFFTVFFYSMPIFLLIIIGMVFCILPGIYLAIVFVPFSFIIIMEDKNFGDTFNRCFAIIKENFWVSLLIYFVATMIYGFSSGIITMVVGLVAGTFTYLSTKDISTTAGVVTSFASVFSLVFFIIYFVSAAFQYFNLVEIHDGTGILNRINSIGENDPHSNTEEEY